MFFIIFTQWSGFTVVLNADAPPKFDTFVIKN